MIIIKNLRDIKPPRGGSVLTIGVFDGLHLGHRKVIEEVVRRSKMLGLKSAVLTFAPHPLKVLNPKAWIPSLISLDHRLRIIGGLGVDIAVVAKFSKSFARMSAKKFVRDILVLRLRAREIYVSKGFYFGRGASWGISTLRELGRQYGFNVKCIRPVSIGGHVVSSSVIRKMVVKGDIDTAAKLLGRPVSILGTVVRGVSLARELGYPTANINPHHEAIPPSGVYAVRVKFKGRLLKGILNIGLKPTFFGPRDCEPSIEVHIFNFHKRIYREDLDISFVKKIRDEIKFKDRYELVRRIRRDARRARDILA